MAVEVGTRPLQQLGFLETGYGAFDEEIVAAFMEVVQDCFVTVASDDLQAAQPRVRGSLGLNQLVYGFLFDIEQPVFPRLPHPADSGGLVSLFRLFYENRLYLHGEHCGETAGIVHRDYRRKVRIDGNQCFYHNDNLTSLNLVMSREWPTNQASRRRSCG